MLQATVATLWDEAQLAQIAWAQRGQSLLITHPDVPPQQLARVSDTVWTLGGWQFVEIGSPAVTSQPFARFADPDVQMQSSATTGTVTLNTSAAVFIAEHLGGIVRLNGKQVELTNIQTPTQAVGLVLQDLDNTDPTKDWDELAFSDARGWPVAVSFHQDRMVIGGSRDLPSAIWMSKTSDHFNFELGTGLDDEAIAFRLAANNDPGDSQPGVEPASAGLHQRRRVGHHRLAADADQNPGRAAKRDRLAPRPAGAATRRRRRHPVRRAQRPRDPRVPVRRHRAGLPGGRSGAARPPSGPGPGRPGLRPGAAAVPDRDDRRLARQHRDLSDRRHRRLEPARDRRPACCRWRWPAARLS